MKNKLKRILTNDEITILKEQKQEIIADIKKQIEPFENTFKNSSNRIYIKNNLFDKEKDIAEIYQLYGFIKGMEFVISLLK